MSNLAAELVANLNLEVIETLDLPGREERRLDVPDALRSGPLSGAIGRWAADGKLWRHQSMALEKLFERENVVVATGTASGKSLIFQLYAFDRILRDRTTKVLVFYPLKALASDQYTRWQRLAVDLGFEPESVAKIDGDVLTVERAKLMEAANVVLMTPDVCQAWLMRSVGTAPVRRFFERLSMLVLDEAHVYESVFGSNIAFLLRRMIGAKRRSSHDAERRFQIIATTATIKEPAEHLGQLTGVEFAVVDEADNGAPFHERQILHVNGPEYGAGGEAALTDLAKGIRGLSERRRFIAFMDSRQGVERIVKELNEARVLPYRSGYEADDRKRIESALRDGTLDGVVATSALELGIDIADMEIGANLGVPQSRKAFRQRIGRVGRAGPGTFFVIAQPHAFKRFGETFADYYNGSVEPSYLYLGNRFIQFAHARCLYEENEVLQGDPVVPPAGVKWPDRFSDVLKFVRPGSGRPREFDFIAQIGADNPHLNYPLRQVGEAGFRIIEGGAGHTMTIGHISTNQAIREAYPGATYLHMGRAYKINEWQTRSFERAIKASPAKNPVMTRPLLKKTVTLSLAPDGIVEGRIKRNQTGLIAEVHLQVNESVEGYSLGKTNFMYRDLRAENPNMSRKQRDFRTTGVVIRIEEPWFSGSQPKNAQLRMAVADGLMALICRDKSISPQDVDSTHTNIALLTETGPKRLTDAVVLYDSIYGGLRLTEEAFLDLSRFVAQLDKAALLAGSDALVDEEAAAKLCEWVSTLADGSGDATQTIADAPDGFYQIYRPGSCVSILFNGNLVERTIVEPRFADPLETGTKSLFYRYETPTGTGLMPHSSVEATGQEWSWVLWNPETGEFKELEVDPTP